MKKVLGKIDQLIFDVFEKKYQNVAGLIQLIISAIFFATASLLLKFTSDVPFFQQLFFCRGLMWVQTSIFVWHYNLNPYPKESKLQWSLIFRGFVGLGGGMSYFYALTKIPLGEAIFLLYTSPIWTGIFAQLLLGEPQSWLEFGCAFIGLIGIVFIAQPPFLFTVANDVKGSFSLPNLYGKLAALVTSFFSVAMYLIVRTINIKASTFLLVYYFSFFGAVGASVGMILSGNLAIINLKSILILILVSICWQLQQTTMNRGVQLQKAGIASIFGYLQGLLGQFFDFLILKTELNAWSVIGSCIILFSAFIVFYKNLTTNIATKN